MFDFSKVVDRHGTWCTQWDYVADRFGTADLLPFTISDMDFATAPCIIEALNQRLMHGVFGYSRWKNDEFLAAIAHWFSTQHYTAIDSQTVVYGPSVIYMVSELIRQWSETGEGVVIHTPAYDAFYKAIEGNQRTVMPVALEKQADGWFCDMGKLEAVLAKPECKIMLLCSPQNPTGKVWTCDELEIMADLCERHIDDNALQKALIEQEKVAIMPGYTYGEEGRGFVRLNAGCPRSKLEKGVAGLINAIRAVR